MDTPNTPAGNPPAEKSNIDLNKREFYINREISLLRFHLRVLEQALNDSHPLLDRLNFLLIFSSNLDEFFEIRVSGLLQQAVLHEANPGPDGLLPSEVLDQISDTCHQAVVKQYDILNNQLLPELEKENIKFLRREQWSEEQAEWVKQYFKDMVAPVLTPIGLDPAHPFPKLVNKSLNFIVSLDGKDAFGRQSGLAIIPAPRSLPRIIRLPDELSDEGDNFVFLSSIIHEYASSLFPGMKAKSCHQFRLTRNADLVIDEDELEDLAGALKGGLISRRFGDAVRLEVVDNCPEELYTFLLKEFELTERDLYLVNGPVNLTRLSAAYNVNRPRLKYEPFVPGMPSILKKQEDVFEAIRKKDILLNHPFESFKPVSDLLAQAAKDPQVLAIKQTLYRTGANSDIVNHLVEAARNGKEVTAVIELRARFDEAQNIEVAKRLQEAGAVLVYGIVGYKTHAKMILIVRREAGELKRYVHLGTGNYHAGNARLYTDYSLLSSDVDLCEDVHKIFQELTGMGRVLKLKKMFHAPFTLQKELIKHIEQEKENALAGKPSRIIFKANAITEREIMQALYNASQAGVEIDLIIRGISCLRPGIKGVSENIRVRSIVDRFLEHTRVYYFENNKTPLIYCSSADLMGRNLHSRVETCFPIDDPDLVKRVKKEAFDIYLQDNQRSWVLQSDGQYELAEPEADPFSAQAYLLNALAVNKKR